MCWGKPPTEAVAIQRRSVNKQGLPDKPGLVEDMHRAQIWNLCSDRKDVRRNVKQKQGHRLQIKYPIYLSATKATISVSTKMTEINNNKEEIWIISSFLQVRRSAKTKYHKDLTKLEALFFMLRSVAILGRNKAVYVTASFLLSLLPPFQIFFPVYAIKCC